MHNSLQSLRKWHHTFITWVSIGFKWQNSNSNYPKQNKRTFLKSEVINPRLDQLQVQIDSGFQGMSLGLCFSIPWPYFPISLFCRQLGSQFVRKGSLKNMSCWVLIKGKNHSLTTRLYQIWSSTLAFVRSCTHPMIVGWVVMQFSDWPSLNHVNTAGPQADLPHLSHPTSVTRNGLSKGK